MVEHTVDDEVFVRPHIGKVDWHYGRKESPDLLHDTEDDAIAYAHNQNQYGDWLILPVVSFDNL